MYNRYTQMVTPNTHSLRLAVWVIASLLNNHGSLVVLQEAMKTEAITVKPVYSDHLWATKKWS